MKRRGPSTTTTCWSETSIDGPEPVVVDDQQWLDGQLDALLSAKALAQPIGPGGIPWTPSAAPPASIDGEPLGDEDNLPEEAAAEESEEATLVDSAATSVVGEEDVALWPPHAGDSPFEQQERRGPEVDEAEACATTIATVACPVATATDASSAAGMLGYLQKKLDVRIGEVESRLTNALSGALSDISASERAMIDQMTRMNDRMQSEAALQRETRTGLWLQELTICRWEAPRRPRSRQIEVHLGAPGRSDHLTGRKERGRRGRRRRGHGGRHGPQRRWAPVHPGEEEEGTREGQRKSGEQFVVRQACRSTRGSASACGASSWPYADGRQARRQHLDLRRRRPAVRARPMAASKCDSDNGSG